MEQGEGCNPACAQDVEFATGPPFSHSRPQASQVVSAPAIFILEELLCGRAYELMAYEAVDRIVDFGS